MVVLKGNLGTREVEAGGPRAQGSPWLHETLSSKTKLQKCSMERLGHTPKAAERKGVLAESILTTY